MSSEPKWLPFRDAFREILLHKWDTLDIGYIVPRDEYDSYIASIYTLLREHASVEKIANHLREVEGSYMGVFGRNQEQLIDVARSLQEAYQHVTSNFGLGQ